MITSQEFSLDKKTGINTAGIRTCDTMYTIGQLKCAIQAVLYIICRLGYFVWFPSLRGIKPIGSSLTNDLVVGKCALWHQRAVFTHKPAVGDARLCAQVIEICGHFEL